VTPWVRRELQLGVVIAAYSTLLGAVVGLVWEAGAPTVHLADAINGNEAAGKPLIGDDIRLGLLGIVAGIIAAAVVLIVRRDRERGPGEVLGLAVGGLLGALVAARVGELARHHQTVSTIAKVVPGATSEQTSKILDYFGFHVRATGVLLFWPIAAVAVHLLVSHARQWMATPRRGNAGAGR
jgi:hypothetical protein